MAAPRYQLASVSAWDLARALFGNPFLIVLDEPNSNLDTAGEEALTSAILSVRARGGIVVVVAHRPSALAGIDQILVLNEGRMQAFGPKEEVFEKFIRKPVAVTRRTCSEAEGRQGGPGLMLMIEDKSGQTRPRRSARRAIRKQLIAGVALAAVFGGGLGGLAATTEIAGAVIAPGQLAIDSSVKKVQHQTGGVVGEIRVKEGAQVTVGDIRGQTRRNGPSREPCHCYQGP